MVWQINASSHALRRSENLADIKVRTFYNILVFTYHPDKNRSRRCLRFQKFLLVTMATGTIYRQELVSLVPAYLLHRLKPDASRILDMCAAPGTKAAFITDLISRDSGHIAQDGKERYSRYFWTTRQRKPLCVITVLSLRQFLYGRMI